MINHAEVNMYKPRRAVSMLWVWAWVWAWCVPGGWCAAPIPLGLTTEATIWQPTANTPKPSPPPPPGDFALTYEEAFANFVKLTVGYNATLNFTRVVVSYEDPVDTSRHVITLNISLGGNGFGFNPNSVFEPGSGRSGFMFRLGGLYRRRRYALKAVGQGPHTRSLTTTLSFLTGDDNGEDKLYNLTGIFLVVGILTIIMVVVIVCVGYEKLLHQREDECCNVIFCKSRKKKLHKSSVSPEPLVVRDGRGFDESPSSLQRY